MKTYKHIILASALFYTAVSAAQTGFSFLEPQSASQTANEDRQASLYNEGTQLMNDGKWEKAAEKFNAAAKIQGSRSAGSLYWAGFSMFKLGMRNEAGSLLRDVVKIYPASPWRKTAEQTMLEMGLLKPTEVIQNKGNAEKDPNEDLKLMALRRICEEDEERCVPLVRRFLENPANSGHAKEKSMFILVQSGSAAAQQLVGEIARGKVYPALQIKAIQNLGVEGTEANLATLSEIYSGSNDVQVKKKILESFGVAGDEKRLLAAAKGETNPELQRKAVQGLGVAGAGKELRELYKQVTDPNMKIYILEGLMVAGDDDVLAEIARTETDQRVRMKAIHQVGVAGGKKTGATLLAIWNANTDYETRKAVSEALFVSGDSTTLIQLAKAEKDPAMKRRLVEKISLMGDKPSRDYMIQILEQE
ncbi:MAG TPA: tetratricopeptide repeat protein [Terriglobales bacterium]|nr:tetratricopeptide repeat protein [Terriglobales bacterium]